MTEFWDACDANFNKIEGMTLVRGEPVPRGMLHLVCDVTVRHTDGTYLLMQRDPQKHYGGLWEATAGGSALQGETPLACAIRELREETGYAVKRRPDGTPMLRVLPACSTASIISATTADAVGSFPAPGP